MAPKFRFVQREPIHYPEDVARIRRVLQAHGYMADPWQAQVMWESYSNFYFAASWLVLPDDDAALWAALEQLIDTTG